MLYYSIVMVSIGSLSTGSPSLSTFSAGECSNAILYSIVMVSIGSLRTGSPSVGSFSSGERGKPYYSIVMVSIGSSSGF